MEEKRRLLRKHPDQDLVIFKEFIGTFGNTIQRAGMGKKL